MDENRLNGYSLSRDWFNFSFENPELVNTNHTAMFLWLIELNNRMGWAKKFSSPASQTMNAIGIKSYNTYKKTFNDLVQFGFVKVIQESKNQYTACIIALSSYDKALDKALDKAITMHVTKQHESTGESSDSIIKQINNKTKNQKPINDSEFSFEDFWTKYPVRVGKKDTETAWKKLSIVDKEKCILDIPYYIRDKPLEISYLNPATYINKRRFEDDRSKNTPTTQTSVKHKFGENQKGAINHGE